MNHYFKLKDYEDIVGRYNPMGIRTDKGPLSFATLTEAYYYVIEKLFVTFPRGYLTFFFFFKGISGPAPVCMQGNEHQHQGCGAIRQDIRAHHGMRRDYAHQAMVQEQGARRVPATTV